MKLVLRYSVVLNGEYNPSDINLIMVFQVNCPGCFIHGFPLMNHLQTQYQGKLSCFALSTAFEDFDLNTIDNTRLLTNNNEFVGETLKAHKAGLFNWKKVTFPILVDEKATQTDLLDLSFIDSVIQNRREWETIAELEKQKVRATLKDYFIQLPECGYTFAVNLMQGTPTFLLFNQTLDILLGWFGYTDTNLIEERITTFIKKNNE